MEMVRCILFVGIARLISPIDTNLLRTVSIMILRELKLDQQTDRIVYAATVESLHCSFGGPWVVVINEAVIEALILSQKSN